MQILVTGGTGFLGSHLARALLAQGHRVGILGRDFRGVDDLLTAGAQPVAVDLTQRQAVIAACAEMDVVFHVAALSAAWARSHNAFYAANVSGTSAVIEGCLRHHVRRLVYVSSPAVVFDGRDHQHLNETAAYPRRFTSTYALTKKIGEDLVNQATHRGLATVILRPKAIFGPGDRALLPRLLAAARQGRLRQFGHGRNLVDLTYVGNVVDALLLAMDAPNAPGHTYFITNGEHVPLWPTIRMLLDQLGLPRPRPLALPLAMALARLMEIQAAISGREPLLTRYSVAILARTQTYDISAAQRDLGYQPRVSVVEGITRTLHQL
ncbi:MAG: NAD-dependent epimerase/dehydratase family protein [Caldilineaceae bacterium]|nr:NAD-dependent epimerase/dehydratase family protein [Caldilineaceae bacterium]